MHKPTLNLDIAIIGGGVAGLWALNQLRACGYAAVLFEPQSLGSGQSIAAQGIIHSGIKYAMDGLQSEDSQTLAAMPQAWRDCMAGIGSVNLKGCKPLHKDFFVWSVEAFPKPLRELLMGSETPSHPLVHPVFPTALQVPAPCAEMYRLDDFVINPHSLLQTLAENQHGYIFQIDWAAANLKTEQNAARIEFPNLVLNAQQVLLCGGAGNEHLLAQLGATGPAMQRRPVQQVLVKQHGLPTINGHCISTAGSVRLTLTTHPTSDGEIVWYLGGDLATSNSGATQDNLIETAQREITELFPGLSLVKAEWRTLLLDRAEMEQAGTSRPVKACVETVQGTSNTRVLWPTKLSLCPPLGDELLRQLRANNIHPGPHHNLDALQILGRPPVAEPPWETLFR